MRISRDPIPSGLHTDQAEDHKPNPTLLDLHNADDRTTMTRSSAASPPAGRPGVDDLAASVLVSAGLDRAPSCGDGGGPSSPTPNLDRLERSLGVPRGGGARRRPPPRPDAGAGTRTAPPGGVWSWTPSPDGAESPYRRADGTADERSVGESEADDRPRLDEADGLPPEFYRSVGELVAEAFRPADDDGGMSCGASSPRGSPAGVDGAASGIRRRTHNPRDVGGPDGTVRLHSALLSLESYALPGMCDPVRVTRVLLAMHEGLSDGDRPFWGMLLRYCEGMALPRADGGSGLGRDGGVEDGGGDRGKKGAGTGRGRRIPVLSSLFRHWSSLPDLESSVRRVVNTYSNLLPTSAGEYRAYTDHLPSGTTRDWRGRVIVQAVIRVCPSCRCDPSTARPRSSTGLTTPKLTITLLGGVGIVWGLVCGTD